MRSPTTTFGDDMEGGFVGGMWWEGDKLGRRMTCRGVYVAFGDGSIGVIRLPRHPLGSSQ